ncbi:MAG: F0F1 ATP synthase subunit B [Holophagales bacterium]|nr:F0F1 ATP synthase subunit B [Holophagales bacterium]
MQRTTLRALLSALVTCCLALPVWAAGGEGKSDNNIFAGDLGNILWTLITFGLVLFVLGKYVWGPLGAVIQKREDFIRESLEKAQNDREAAEARLAEYAERLADSRAEASAIVDQGRIDAEDNARRIIEQAKQEASKERDRALRDIGIARETAVKELYELSGKLAAEIAGRIVGRELDAAAHEKLISDTIDELTSKAEAN